MSRSVHLIDYGLGNLHSVRNALQRIGADVVTVEHGGALAGAERIVLPGVGAFADGMAGLAARDLIAPLRAAVERGAHLLGICLGAQLLMSESTEFGRHEGLGILPGRVAEIPSRDMRVPHVGWSPIVKSGDAGWRETALSAVPEGTFAYFVHSYEMLPGNPRHLLAYTTCGGYRIAAAVGAGRILGVQFHPEKSGDEGLRMLRTYVHDSTN